MAEPLKAMYDLPFLRQFAARVTSAWAPFDGERFVQRVTGEGWEALELKARIRRIATSLGAELPDAYPEALAVLIAIHQECSGFPYLFFPDFVEVYGLHDWERSMDALEKFTSQSSAEFAIRAFIMQDTERTMARMQAWSLHENEHIRRLASEGCRPRLPWGQMLPMFKRDPSPILPILEQLKADPSLYVRKSVANNLNDIAKDNPAVVKAIASEWKGSTAFTDWIVRHGCRSLIKAADPEVLALFGYEEDAAASAVASAAIHALQEEAVIGGSSELRYSLRLADGDGDPLRLRIELGVSYVKSGGKTSQKRFLLSDKTLRPGSAVNNVKLLDWKNLSTRKHYAGLHRIALVVNGTPVAETSVLLHDSLNTAAEPAPVQATNNAAVGTLGGGSGEA
ncbi:DNA alkylation repair protein [Paenibacillus sp. R14(2021)]|uniref:DNA alkylation repair protein n=1 Tax=Paenibacillus sp. R14(2021) TaxID=2859228 RepID=UPI001C61612A|nr:DNA alkylation repair protein [Paenibacillus sp. R14(2021)]